MADLAPLHPPAPPAPGQDARISSDWALDQLQQQWPGILIDPIFPPVHPLKWHARALMPTGETVGIRLLSRPSDDAEGLARITAAYHRASHLTQLGNPGSARILHCGNLGGCLLVVSQWHEAVPWIAYRQETNPEPGQAFHLIDQLAQALQSWHQAGWVHGHLRSDAVIVTPAGRVLFSGHGLLDVLTGQVPGPLDADRVYLAPELNGHEDAERLPSGDVYSLGVVAYELLTGERPAGHFMKLPSQVTGAGKWLDDVILRAIHPDPHKRIASVEEFRAAMAARELRLMDLSAPEENEEVPEKKRRLAPQPAAKSGVMSELRGPFVWLFSFALLVIAASLYAGIRWHGAFQDAEMTMEDTILAMGELVAAISGEGEEIDVEAIVAQIAQADPDVQWDALQETVAKLQEEGSYEEALALAEKMAEIHQGKEGESYEAMQALCEALRDAPAEYAKWMDLADDALLAGDAAGEIKALEGALSVYPQDRTALRRLAQTSGVFTTTWNEVETQLRRWNPTQQSWHPTLHRSPSGLELDLSGHPNLIYLQALEGLPIDRLDIRHTGVRDLAPLGDMKLTALWADQTDVSQLAPLAHQPLETLTLTHTQVRNFGLAEQLPFLRHFRIDPQNKRPSVVPPPRARHEWENSLGQRFLPLIGSSVKWVARRELSREAYRQRVPPPEEAATPPSDASTPEEESDLHPVLLTLTEAEEFCRLLTQHEQKMGTLPSGARYRLPTPTEAERLRHHVSLVTAPASAAGSSKDAGKKVPALAAPTLRAVAQGDCQRGFFDVLDNAPEWERTTPQENRRGLRLWLEIPLSEISPGDPPPILEAMAEAKESSESP